MIKEKTRNSTVKSSLVGALGKTIDSLRLSITDRCNLRCLYCMPAKCVKWVPHSERLQFDETLKICRILAGLGIRAVKITGGEPAMDQRLVDYVKELKAIKGIKRVTMTSNGVLLGKHLPALAAAGLDGINISLDTLSKETFKSLTTVDGLEYVLSAIDQAVELGLKVKINSVPVRGFNENDIVKLAALAKDGNLTVRFCELMPFGVAAKLQPIRTNEAASLIEKEYGPMKPSVVKLGNGPAVYYSLPGFTGHIGFINAANRDSCEMLRLSCSGNLYPYLFSDLSLNLRGLIRESASREEIKDIIRNLKLNNQRPVSRGFGKKEMFRIGG